MFRFLILALAPWAVSGYNLDPNQDLNTLGNNALFDRWRPQYHFIAPSGWMNDPCSAMYDPTRDTYHMFYQFHPNHIDWGNISWGHATSKDMVTWVDVRGWENDEAQALCTGPNGSYDHLGIFSGTGQPINLHGEQDGNLTLFYTSVKILPEGWNVGNFTLLDQVTYHLLGRFLT